MSIMFSRPSLLTLSVCITTITSTLSHFAGFPILKDLFVEAGQHVDTLEVEFADKHSCANPNCNYPQTIIRWLNAHEISASMTKLSDGTERMRLTSTAPAIFDLVVRDPFSDSIVHYYL